MNDDDGNDQDKEFDYFRLYLQRAEVRKYHIPNPT